MRPIPIKKVVAAIKELILHSAFELPEFVKDDLSRAMENESSPLAKEMLSKLLENASIAQREGIPLCQDSGLPKIVFEMGESCHLTGRDLIRQITQAIGEVYQEGHLRLSAADPLSRVNLETKIPLRLEWRMVKGSCLTITTMAKGGGCDNKSVLFNMVPTAKPQEIKKAILEKVSLAGPDACPPYYIGICLGASFDSAPLYASMALEDLAFKDLGEPEERKLSSEYLLAVNQLGIGPMAMGGKTTALGLKVRVLPTHIASLPVAINFSCHSFRIARTCL